MRVYRLIILLILAGLTVILLGTAVYALQTPFPAPITHQEECEFSGSSIYADNVPLPFHQDATSQNEP